MILNSEALQKPKEKSKRERAEKKIALATFLNENTLEEEKSLRPNRLSQLIGQEKITKQLGVILESAKIRAVVPEHILFYGQPGLGKTTLACLIANELECNFQVVSAPSLQKNGDLVSLLLNLQENTVLFIDEIHRLKLPLEEILYMAMEDGKVDLVMGKGSGANVARLDIPSFTLVGATTQLGRLSKPLKDRFASIFQLESYSSAEIIQLMTRTSQILGLDLQLDSMNFLSDKTRGVPRITNNLLKRLLDYKIVHKIEKMSPEILADLLQELGIFELGLTNQDITYLKALRNGTTGLKTLGSMIMEDTDTVEFVVEPYLIYLGFMEKESSGRRLTHLGRDFIDKIQ